MLKSLIKFIYFVKESYSRNQSDLKKYFDTSKHRQVQPIAELCELSRRRAADGGVEVELSDSNVRGGTLSRSGSRRFTSTQVSVQCTYIYFYTYIHMYFFRIVLHTVLNHETCMMLREDL